MSNDPEETVQEYHAKLMAAEVRQLFRSVSARDHAALGNSLFWLSGYLPRVVSRYLTLPKPTLGEWKWNAHSWRFDQLQLQNCKCIVPNQLHLVGTMVCSKWVLSDSESAPVEVVLSNQQRSTQNRAKIRWIEPFEFRISLNPSTGSFASCLFRLGDNRPFERKQVDLDTEFEVLPESALVNSFEHESWLEEIQQVEPIVSELTSNDESWLPKDEAFDLDSWKQACLKVANWYVQWRRNRTTKVLQLGHSFESRLWLQTTDEMLAAHLRVFLRARLTESNLEVVEHSWFHVEGFLENVVLPTLLASQHSRWNGGDRWIDGTGLELVSIDASLLRFQSGCAFFMLKQSRWYYQPCELEIELFPVTHGFKKYVLRFGDHRPLKSCKEFADPNHPVGGWAYQFERFPNSASVDAQLEPNPPSFPTALDAN